MAVLEVLEQRALFRLTRFVAFIVILCLTLALLVGVGIFASDFLPNHASHVSYSSIAAAIHPPTSNGSVATQSNEPVAASPEVGIPFVLQPYFGDSDNHQVLLKRLEELDSDERRDYLDNLAEVVTSAKSQGADVTAVINKYFEVKASQMDLAKADRNSRLLRQVYVAASFVSTLMLISLASLILVLLAIERNTRRGEHSFAAN